MLKVKPRISFHKYVKESGRGTFRGAPVAFLAYSSQRCWTIFVSVALYEVWRSENRRGNVSWGFLFLLPGRVLMLLNSASRSWSLLLGFFFLSFVQEFTVKQLIKNGSCWSHFPWVILPIRMSAVSEVHLLDEYSFLLQWKLLDCAYFHTFFHKPLLLRAPHCQCCNSTS